ncbi:MAG TPA: hypothetical protein PKL13_04785, partial [bacterium]|nr:hypothetical protein [bacterium]
MINKKLKIILIIIVTIFIINIIFIAPQRSRAMIPVADIPGNIWNQIEKIFQAAKQTLVATTYKKTISTFLNTLAYNAAVDLAEGAGGGQPLLYTKNWKDYLADAGDAGAAAFLTEFGGAVSSTMSGFDICNPTDPQFKVDIVTNKLDLLSGKKPSVNARCTFTEMANKWGDLGKKYYDDRLSLLSLNGASLKELGFGKGLSGFEDKIEYQASVIQSLFNIEEQDIVIEGSIDEAADEAAKKEKEEKERQRKSDEQTEMGGKSGRQVINENPSSLPGSTKQQLEAARGDNSSKDLQLEQTGNPLADAMGIFAYTYTSRFLKKFSGFFYSQFAQRAIDSYRSRKDGIRGAPLSVRDYIDQIYSSVKKISFNTSATDIDLITEMQMTMRNDQSGIPGSLNDSVIDSDFAEVLRMAQTGNPITLKQAVEDDLISGSKIFGFKDLGNAQISQQPDLNEGISYDNMKKLRKNRVIPVGWELAALKISQLAQNGTPICPQSGCTLNDVMNQYGQYGVYKKGDLINGEIQWQTVRDESCGWRPYSPLIKQDDCNKDALREAPYYLDDIEVRWVGINGGNNQRTGICYQYNFDTNGILSGIVEVPETNEANCQGAKVDSYYEWMEGGCLIKEKGEAPLCGLVNPNWVLKAPAQKCYANGYYSALEMSESSNRYQDCADTRQCLKEDENGKCIGEYGYCLREKNIWRFQGDVCDKNFNGCVTLKDDENKQQSYLINTLRDCPQEQSGCRKYLSTKTLSDESYIWAQNTGNFYFNGNIQSCNKSKDGCSNFINIERGVNLIPNGSFEIDEGRQDLIPDGWTISGAKLSTSDAVYGRYSIASITGEEDNTQTDEENVLGIKISAATGASVGNNGTSDSIEDIIDGDTIEELDSESSLSIDIKVPGRGNYVLSYYAKTNDEGAYIYPYINDVLLEDAIFDEYEATNWTRRYASYTIFNNSVDTISLSIYGGGNFYIDNIQLEFIDQSVSGSDETYSSGPGATPSVYNEYGAASNVFFKKAPDYYNCKSDNPAPECVNYSKYCSREDSGCELYRPVNNDVSVSAIVTNNDICPSECNKFDAYSQLPNYFDKLEAEEANQNIPDPITRNFIADTAKNCSEPSCEEFTNVGGADQGGENKEYYKLLRQCVTPTDVNNEISIYYTWEGSDTSGFQLKTWKLLKSDQSENNIEGRNAPCTHITIGGFECSDNLDQRSCNPETDLDCRTFYDMNSISYNRKLSKTIPITDECINLRRTLSNAIYKA